MNTRPDVRPSALIGALSLAVALLLALAPPAAAEQAVLETHFALLAGIPGGGDDGASGVLVVPGTVLPLSGNAVAGGEDRSAEIASVASQLRRTLRLDDVRVLYSYPTLTPLNEETELPPPTTTSGLRVSVTLQGYNQELATYAVRLQEGSRTFTDSVVSVPRGRRSVVGGLDGEEAPYLFLVVSPAAGPPKAQRVGEGITPPRRLSGDAPTYTEEARKERIQGVVIVQTIIDENGGIEEAEVLKGLPMGLSEAAVEAIRTWKFEPALDDNGNPVAVYYNMTVNFRLDSDKPAEKTPDTPHAP